MDEKKRRTRRPKAATLEERVIRKWLQNEKSKQISEEVNEYLWIRRRDETKFYEKINPSLKCILTFRYKCMDWMQENNAWRQVSTKYLYSDIMHGSNNITVTLFVTTSVFKRTNNRNREETNLITSWQSSKWSFNRYCQALFCQKQICIWNW